MGKGLGPNDPETADGKQTKIDFAFDLVCPQAMLALARVLQEGRERGRTEAGWKSLPTADHLNHALMHVYAHQAGDRQEDHLQHALCRLMMAWSTANTVPVKEEPQFKYVYLCYPYSDRPAVRTAKIVRWARAHKEPNVQFLIPHVIMSYMSEVSERKLVLEKCRYMVSKCDEIWVIGNHISFGMLEEVEEADKRGVTIRRMEE